MKTTFLLSLLLAFFSLNVFAEQAETIKRIHLNKTKVTPKVKPGTRSVQLLYVSAYLSPDNSVLVVDFLREYDEVQILIISALTGEMIYSDSYTTPTNVVIAMPEMEKGREYLLEISLGETILSGEFSIE